MKHYARWKTHGDANCLKRTPAGVPILWISEHKNYQLDDCLIWPFFREENGYGQTVFNGKKSKASRVMCIMAHGEPEGDGYQAAHSCGNGHIGCVNPRHLRWATHKENGSDMVAHGRSTRGRKNPMARLTDAQVLEIRAVCDGGSVSQSAIGKMYGISQSTVSTINLRQNWAWLA